VNFAPFSRERNSAVFFADVILADVSTWLPPILNSVLLILSLFLILLVLIQRGKGGGLAGAFGGAGGSSAFGSRAGDTFTRYTIYLAAVWLLLIMITIKVVQGSAPSSGSGGRPVPMEDGPDQ
jgi:preprotein translocase subunit SecG